MRRAQFTTAPQSRALFIWENCTTGKWELRLAGGGDSGGVRISGRVISNGGFTDLTPVSLEPNDTFDGITNPNELIYQLNVWNAAVDGFGFNRRIQDDACLILDNNVSAFLGSGKLPVSGSLDLDTLQTCDAPPVPVQCGRPEFRQVLRAGFVYLAGLCRTRHRRQLAGDCCRGRACLVSVCRQPDVNQSRSR